MSEIEVLKSALEAAKNYGTLADKEVAAAKSQIAKLEKERDELAGALRECLAREESRRQHPEHTKLAEEVERLRKLIHSSWRETEALRAENERLKTDNTILVECAKDTIHQIQSGCFNDEEWTTNLINGLRKVLAALQSKGE